MAATVAPPRSPQRTRSPSGPVTTDPRLIRFSEIEPESAPRHLKITNTSTARLAWRVLSNAPKYYLVNPNKGFIGPRESLRVEVTLLEKKAYLPMHQFVVQLKKAEDQEVDREDVWESTDARPMQNIRVVTAMDRDASRPRLSSSSSGTSIVSSSSATSLPSSKPEQNLDHGVHTERINLLQEEAKKALNNKAEKTRRLCSLVNDVKLLELDLDKATNALFDATRRLEGAQTQLNEEKKESEKVKKQKEAMQ